MNQSSKLNSNLSGHPVFNKLRCPITSQVLYETNGNLINQDGNNQYRISDSGIPLFAESLCSVEANRQREHYDKIAAQYTENLGYPHTIEYMLYLDKVFLEHVDRNDLKEVAELCCGHGELLSLLPNDIGVGVGADISQSMLEFARKKHEDHKSFLFIQADATRLPLCNDSFQSVFMFGGIHHVPNREELFQEIFRILRPGGRFYFREPVSDFFLWRWIRAIVYRLSPILDAETERPLVWGETVPLLEQTGFQLRTWKTYGFLGFCFFMNSDVLVFNRLFRFIPGIRSITRLVASIDDITLKIPGLAKAGLQVVGVAEKPVEEKA
jgi:SAM-dependent methyltransferase